MLFESEEDRQHFLTKYNISQNRFRESLLSWDTLREIADDFEVHRNEHLNTVQEYALAIQQCSSVHSLSFRVKDTEHLIEKIIRKNGKYAAEGKTVTKKNYKEYITDLMGLRILLLFKEDWREVHSFLTEKYRDKFMEEPFAYIRKGDRRNLYDGIVRIIEDRPYRSVHYVIRHENGAGLEIQVRTLFEEAWSEVDHKLRYPYNIGNEMMNGYLNIMNRAAGMADEMGTFINSYIKSFEEISGSGMICDNDVYNYIIDRISKCEDEELKVDIIGKIRLAEDFQELNLMSDVLKDILKKYR